MSVICLGSLPQRVSKSDLMALLVDVGGLDRRRIGRIELRGFEAAIEVPDDWPARLVKALDGQPLGNRRVRAWVEASTGQQTGSDDLFDRLARLLDLESRAEAEQALERARRLSPTDAERTGATLVDLVVRDEEMGLGGRHLVELAKRNGSPLPWTRLRVGTPVMLSPEKERGKTSHRGVVSERSAGLLQVALGNIADDLDAHETWRVDQADDEVATERQRRALQQVKSASGDRLSKLRDTLLGISLPRFLPEVDEAELDPGLNSTQQAAVKFALSAADVALIHGPPGTGKTTTVVELIRRAIRRGEKVLACAPSHTAVDNIFERLVAYGEKAVRLGHPARVTPALRAHTLDLLVDDHPDVRLARKLVKEARTLFRQTERYTRAKPTPGAKREARQEAKSLLADARRLEEQAAQHILDSARVLCATTTGLDSALLGSRRFDLTVIDEACQTTEPGCWIPITRSDRVVLAGDHCQLPPTVVSREAAAEGFGRSLFERLLEDVGPQVSRRLVVQYRMHQAIMEFSSLEFYEAELEADASVRAHLLSDRPGLTATELTQSAIEFIDTAGAGYEEELEPDGESRLNPEEAAFVERKAQQLFAAGLLPRDLAIITPYAAQVRHLRERLPVPELEIDSVDGFQGREKEAVIISCVRSNAQGEIGFLSDIRRMNVALTRARRKLIVIGDSATLSSHPLYVRMIEYFESEGAYHTVWESGC